MTVLISGASTGIGRAIALHLAASGETVWAGVRNTKAFDDLSKAGPKRLKPLILDVTDVDSIRKALGRIKRGGGRLDALINNAGIVVGGPIEGLSLNEWRRQFEVNFFGTIELTKACLPLLRESKGRVINMSSVAGRVSSPFLGPYSASKFALEAFSDALRREMRDHGVKVSVVEPGPIQTPIWDKSTADNEQLEAGMSDDIKQLYGASITRFKKSVAASAERAAPVALVVRAVDHALKARYPRTRYPVGPGIGVVATMSDVLPDVVMDRLLDLKI